MLVIFCIFALQSLTSLAEATQAGTTIGQRRLTDGLLDKEVQVNQLKSANVWKCRAGKAATALTSLAILTSAYMPITLPTVNLPAVGLEIDHVHSRAGNDVELQADQPVEVMPKMVGKNSTVDFQQSLAKAGGAVGAGRDERLNVCIFTADFWGLKSAGGTATAYHLLAAVLAKVSNLNVRAFFLQRTSDAAGGLRLPRACGRSCRLGAPQGAFLLCHYPHGDVFFGYLLAWIGYAEAPQCD